MRLYCFGSGYLQRLGVLSEVRCKPVTLKKATETPQNSEALRGGVPTMAAGREVSVVTIGGKGSSLSSSSVYAIANGLSQVRIDSAVTDKLSKKHSLSTVPLQNSKSRFLTLEESRAALVVLLNKIALSNAGIRDVLAESIVETLNVGFNPESLDFGSVSAFLDSLFGLKSKKLEEVGVTDGELAVLENSSAALVGISALLDHSSSVLSTVADVVAALSCEATKANVSAFNSLDSGDGFSAKDETAVASDMKILLVGSKLVGRVDSDAISEIPEVHGSFREVVRSVHARMRVELNSMVKFVKGGSGSSGCGKVLMNTLWPLASALQFLGESSLRRARLNVESISPVDLRTQVLAMLERSCPTSNSMNDAFQLIWEAKCEVDYVRFLHEIYCLLLKVRVVVAWEGALALFSLEKSDSNEKAQVAQPARADANGGNANAERKGEKKKKVLGKGTTVVRQLIKDRLQNQDRDVVENVEVLTQWAQNLSLFFDPKDPDLDVYLKKVKEILESNESRRLPKIPKGTRDFAKEQMAIRKRAFSIIEDVFEMHGASALDTPVFELRETLMGKYGEDSKLIYDLADQGGELCSLRYDLTVPFARYVAMNGLSSFKRYQISKVYRRDNPSKGRYREFYQCDFDIAGHFEVMGPDFEVVKILTELLDGLNIGDYEIKLNHRKLLDGMLEICGVPQEKFRTICSSIDKLDKQSFEQVKKEMVEDKGLSVDTADRIGTYVKKRGAPLEILSELKQEGSQFLEHNGSASALNELQILFNALEKSKCINKVVFDLSLARGLDYYTGVIFEAVFKGTTQVGSIAAGGRYDNLIGMFGTKQVPSVGVSLGIERVFAIMEQLEKDRNQSIRPTKTQILVSILGEDLSQAAELVSELWEAKLKAEFMVNKRVMKHIDRAKESRIPWIVIVGEREQNEGIVKLKDVEANKEEVILRSKIVEELQRRLNISSL